MNITPAAPVRTGPDVDHPVYSNCLESRYLKVLWARAGQVVSRKGPGFADMIWDVRHHPGVPLRSKGSCWAGTSLLMLRVAILSALIASVVLAEMTPPGIYHRRGRVVRALNGSFTIFGEGRMEIPANQQTKLAPHLGEIVDCQYLRMANDLSPSASELGSIQSITVIARSPEALPVAVKVRPTKREYSILEPIEVVVTIENNSKIPQPMYNLNSASTALYQDYGERLRLESEANYYTKENYHLKGYPTDGMLLPGAKQEFVVTSSRMAEPGSYGLAFIMTLLPGEVATQSEFVPVEVKNPTKEERIQALHRWQKAASLDQRIQITQTLIDGGDSTAMTTLLDQLEAGVFTPRGWCYDRAYSLAFKHGGAKGTEIMMKLIESQGGQDRAARMLDGIPNAANRSDLLLSLLNNKKKTRRDISGWVEEPRICDITAAWLAGYSDKKIKFPDNGSEAERNEAVAAVRALLRSNPSAFSLQASP